MNNRPSTTVELHWEGGQRFTSSDGYGHTVTVDAPMKDGEAFEGFKPGELMLTSLAGCSGIDVVDILRKQRQEVTGVDIPSEGQAAAGPALDVDRGPSGVRSQREGPQKVRGRTGYSPV